MAKNAAEILSQWRRKVPAETPKADVEKVVSEYFPGLHEFKSGGSHWLIITDPELKWLQDQGQSTGTIGGTLSLSLVHGKFVKKPYVENLLQAITLKEEWNQIKKEADNDR